MDIHPLHHLLLLLIPILLLNIYKKEPKKISKYLSLCSNSGLLVHHCHFLASLFPSVTIAASWQYEKQKGASQLIEAPGVTNLPSTTPPPCPGEGMLEQATGSACCHDLPLSNCRLRASHCSAAIKMRCSEPEVHRGTHTGQFPRL